MRERTSSTVSIKRSIKNTTVAVASVIFLPSSVRRFSLMTEDYIRLDFSVAAPFRFEIGDFIEDELFGRFVITKEQMPTYDSNTGGYNYALQFDAWYRVWQNKTFMLTTILMDEKHTRIRKESSWNLTENLKTHLYEFLLNLQILGYCDASITDKDELLQRYISIEQDNMEWQKVYHLQYGSTMMLDALNMMAEQWKCEWWITGTPSDFVIHVGKCESKGDAIVFDDSNVASFNPQSNVSHYANKIFVYGSTKNIPASYRKQAVLIVTDIGDDGLIYTDNPLTADMFHSQIPYELNQGDSVAVQNITYTNKSNEIEIRQNNSYDIEMHGCTVMATVSSSTGRKTDTWIEEEWYDWSDPDNPVLIGTTRIYTTKLTVVGSVCLYSDSGERIQLQSLDYQKTSVESGYIEYWRDGSSVPEKTERHEAVLLFGSAAATIENEKLEHIRVKKGRYRMVLVLSFFADYFNDLAISVYPLKSLTAVLSLSEDGTSSVFTVLVSDVPHLMVVNINKEAKWDEDMQRNPDYNSLCFVDTDVRPVPVPDGVEVGTKIVVSENDDALLPSAYFTSQYDNPSSLLKIGERRLMLPVEGGEKDGWLCRDGYIIRKSLADNPEGAQVVEDTVIFDNVYPIGLLQVKSVAREPAHDETAYEGEGQKDIWQWYRYHIQVQLATGAPFSFEESYTLDGHSLEMMFDIPQPDRTYSLPISADGCRLSGMTFGVNYQQNRTYEDIDEGSSVPHKEDYLIIRNDTYGTLLPNDSILPTVGDPCILVNWNVRRYRELGIIDTAESELMEKGFEYAKAIEEDQFTFDCEMQSDFMFIQSALGDGYNDYNIPLEGTKIEIVYGALKERKKSRIIGYQFRLDKPYDSPQYTVGETKAYSRLARIEAEVKRVSK